MKKRRNVLPLIVAVAGVGALMWFAAGGPEALAAYQHRQSLRSVRARGEGLGLDPEHQAQMIAHLEELMRRQTAAVAS